jgi:uncharacterized protein (DUF1330 family)
MKAYAIAAETVFDQGMFDEYRKEVPATLAPFGGKFMVRGGDLTIVEGEWPNPRSAAYQKVISLRHKSTTGSLIIVEGA